MVIEEPRPKKRPTVITYALIVICVVVFIFTLSSDGNTIRDLPGWWFVPEEMFAGVNLHTLVTAAFLHGSWMHIISNMYFLWVFGDDAEDSMGRFTFLVFYLFCAVFASFFFALTTALGSVIMSDPTLVATPCVGASGAIFGVMAAYAIFFPNRTIIVPGWGRVTAKWYIIIYAIFEVVYTFLDPTGTTAHMAHVGGFIAGVFFVFAFKKLSQDQYTVTKTVFLPAGKNPPK
jgi:membrane associated rhomboid family serine protease